MKYSTVIDREASKPSKFVLTCPDCGAPEHAATENFASLLVFSCGRVEAYSKKNSGEWDVICSCPALAWDKYRVIDPLPKPRYWLNSDTGRVIEEEHRPGHSWDEIDYGTYRRITHRW